MAIGEKKGAEPSEGISLLNQLTMTLEEAGLKLEEAYKRNNPEQLKAIKEFILKIQNKIAEEIK